jgi:hypothetical protein
MQSPYFLTFMEPRNRFQGMNSASLCSVAGRYDNPITSQFLALIDSLKIPAQDKIVLYRHDEPNEPTKEGPALFVLHKTKSPFASVSTVSRGHPYLVSLVATNADKLTQSIKRKSLEQTIEYVLYSKADISGFL